jgi:hypothetical protein
VDFLLSGGNRKSRSRTRFRIDRDPVGKHEWTCLLFGSLWVEC